MREAALARVIIETGWTTHTDRLGAPTGQTLHDFPLGGDDAHNLVIKVMSWFIHEPVSLVNAYFLLGFVLVALAAFAVLRWLRANRRTGARRRSAMNRRCGARWR